MAPPPAYRFLALLALGLVLLGGGLLWLLEAGGGRERAEEISEPAPAVAPDGREQSPESGELFTPARVEVHPEELARTTVLWPLRVELELLEARYLPTEEDLAPIGSGADAKLSGRILGLDERGARAEVRFVAGANRERVLHTDVTGSFGATDLYPGLSIVEVRGTGIIGSRREIRLRQGKETMLNISYGRPGSIVGRVQDREAEAIEGADVRVDGVSATSGPDGRFSIAPIAGGQVLVEVEHPDFAAYQELVWIASGQESSGENVTFTLEPSTSLRVVVTTDIGGPGPVELYILAAQPAQRVHPDAAHRSVRFPYHRLHPTEIWPGRPITIPGLPPQPVHVFAFRAGAGAAERVVNLLSGRETELSLALEPAPTLTGRVVHRGEPVAGATVRLESPNQVRTTLGFFRQPSHFLETDVLPPLPPAVQVVQTDERGRYVLTAWDELSPTRYLEARGPEGKTWAGRLVRAEDTNADLELEEVTFGDSALAVDFPGRWQGLPVEILVDGSPFDPAILPPEEPLLVKDLVAGRWRLHLSWHGDPIHEETLVIDGEATLTVSLPSECVDGQDEEAWRRAGRTYPLGS